MKILILLTLVAASQAVSFIELVREDWDIFKVRNTKINNATFLDYD